jgi:maleylpyruvate isomerase
MSETERMFDPQPDLRRLRAAQACLDQRISGLTDDDVRQPCLLPGWSVGHLLNHIARNADSVLRRLHGAARDEIVDQYPGGPAGRAAEIEAGAGTGAKELIADVAATSRALEQAAMDLTEPAWDRLGRTVDGELLPVSALLASRIKEVEIHHVDLGLGYQPSDWPADFVEARLAVELPGLLARTTPADLLAWLIGRGQPPDLTPWN